MKITSVHNFHIKQAIQLRQRRNRDKNGLTIVEGEREVLLAVASGMAVTEFFICPELLGDNDFKEAARLVIAGGGQVLETSPAVFEKLSFGDRREGVIAVCRTVRQSLLDFQFCKDGLYVVVEGVEKPGNLGAILRTCDAAGVDGLFLCGDSTDIYNPNVIRASLGTVFSIPVIAESPENIFEFFKKNGSLLIAAAPSAGKDYYDVDFRTSAAVILGSEHQGLGDFWLKHADVAVRLPMAGKADSLNVSNTAAVLLYEARRQRMAHG